jgi:Protein of unknown function (DUF2757).
MRIFYECRHCGMNLGKLEGSHFSSEKLGFHKLTEDERAEMIRHEPSGDIKVKTICEDCFTALSMNPDYYENDYIIH